MSWLADFSARAAATDSLQSQGDHLALLAAGLFGEAGSILAELKKMRREAGAYPEYRHRLSEEVGDFLWYFVRIVTTSDPEFLGELPPRPPADLRGAQDLSASLELGASVGDVLRFINGGEPLAFRAALRRAWGALAEVAGGSGVSLEDACEENLAKIGSRWPTAGARKFHPLFDDDSPVEEQLPRRLGIAFLERKRGNRAEVLLRCGDVNLGARLTDNIQKGDDYRYHDIFHIAYAVYLGWSPVVRAILGCKRKSKPEVDENQDGARATVLEEAVSAVVFSRAKQMNFFADAHQVDYDLLKNIQEFVVGFEVERVPLWQWEMAILEGFRLFRELRSSAGGRVAWDLPAHTLKYSAL